MPQIDDATRNETLDEARRARRTVLLLSGTFFFIFTGAGAQQLYIAPYLQDCTEWTGLMRGFVAATVYISMMIFRVGNVYLLRNWSNRRLTFVGSLTYTLFTLVLLATFWLKSYPLAIAAAAVWGWGGAAMWSGTAMQVLEAADKGKRHGTNTGILYSTTHAGWLTGVVLLGLIYQNDSLPPYALYIAATAITLIGNILAALQPPSSEAFAEKPTMRELLQISGRAKVRIAGFLMAASAMSFGLMLGVFGDHIKLHYGKEFIWITAMLYPAGRMLLSLIGGALADRVGHGFLLASGFLSAAVGMLLASQWENLYAMALASLSLALLGGTVPVASTAMIGNSADRKRRPLAYGALFACRDVGVVIAAIWGKLLMREGGEFTETFQTFAIAFVACGLVALLLQRYARERL